jgi:hypothetical protein
VWKRMGIALTLTEGVQIKIEAQLDIFAGVE